jgi:chemotaxis protein CheX
MLHEAIKQSDLEAFVTAALNFFEMNLDKGKISAGTPRLATEQDKLIYDYTGKIMISGDREGCVYFSSPKYLIKHLLLSMGETEFDDDLVCDLVGEIANSIAGNAKSHFGNGFIISTPLISKDIDIDLESNNNNLSRYIVPLTWRECNSNIVVWLN